MSKLKSGIIPKLIIAAVVVYILIAIVSLRVQLAEKKAQLLILNDRISILAEENDSMQKLLLSELTEEQIRQIAREKLGLVSADDEVYYNITSGK